MINQNESIGKKFIPLLVTIVLFSLSTALSFTDLTTPFFLALSLGIIALAVCTYIFMAQYFKQLKANSIIARRSEALLKSGMDCVLIFDLENKPVFISPSIEKVLGYMPEELHDLDLTQFVHPEDLPLALEKLEKSLANPGVTIKSRTSRVKHKDGSWRWVEARMTNFLDDPAINGIVDNFIDVTERVNAQIEMSEMNQKFQLAANITELGLWHQYFEDQIVVWDDKMYEIYGVKRGEFNGLPSTWLKFIYPEDLEYVKDIGRRIANGEAFTHFDFRISRPDKSVRHLRASAILERHPDGKPKRLIGTTFDITEEKQQIVKLDLLNQITKSIALHLDIKSISQVVIQNLEEKLPVDFSMMLLFKGAINKSGLLLLGQCSSNLLREQEIKLSDLDLSVDKSHLFFENKSLYNGDIHDSSNELFLLLSGLGINSIIISPLVIGKQNHLGFILCGRKQKNGFTQTSQTFFIQLGEHVSLALQQAELNNKLKVAYDDIKKTQEVVLKQERLKALGQMASGIAHDINNAISPITLYLDTLIEREKSISEKGTKSLAVIQRAIDDVRETVARMGVFYRKSQNQINFTPINIRELFNQVIDLTRAKWQNIPQQSGKVINISTQVDDNLPILSGIAGELREALTNLIFNAVDAMPNGGNLSLRARVDNGQTHPSEMILIEVSDTGIGMNEKTKRKCLDPFYSTKGERGTGLGLAMVYGTIERHEGNLHIQSTLGKGTTFILELPIHKNGKSNIKPAIMNTPSEKNIAYKILVIDDDSVLLDALVDILIDEGHRAYGVGSGSEGIQTYTSCMNSDSPFDLVITDLGMPEMDGNQVAKNLKAKDPNAKIIMLTGWGQRIKELGEQSEAVNLIISKPPKISELREALVEVQSERVN
ncbi:PAS domain-containing protein [uncultured Roseivirga sp.]|uniref:PAS domain-containing protein n=1 Tax=uncultured Roseivirga sp. TaxID=543088 RepID=UPI00258667B1|nr:PAS domain-containing protein [uncultured Roseivirga sp.]